MNNEIKQFKKSLSGHEQKIVEESTSLVEACKKHGPRRTKNNIALIQPRKGGRPSLGLLYVGAYLQDNQYTVRVFEFLDETYPPNVRYNRRIWKALYDFKPDFIGFSVISSTFTIVQRMIQVIRSKMPEVIIICGGKHVVCKPDDLLRSGADYCTVGESEITIVELLDALNFNVRIDTIKGIAYRNNGGMHMTDTRPFLPLDYILRPAFDLVDYERYVDFRFQGIPGHYLRTGFIFGSRGCPYQCTFCTTNIRGAYRERSIDNLLDEMEWQIKEYKVEAFVILDDIFYFRDERAEEFCIKIVKRNLNINFFCHARVDRVSKKTVELLKQAGLLLLAVGVESGSQKILNAINKGTTIEQIEHAFSIYNDVGVETFAFIIVGHPDETEEDRNLTREVLKRIKPTYVPVSYYMPMPGTPSENFSLSHAAYLLGGDDFKGFTYTTDYPEMSTSIPLEELKKIGDELESLSTKNRNATLFTYPRFIYFIVLFVVCHPFIILEALYLRYGVHKTHQMSLLSVMKDAIQFYKQKF
ncbi:MAG: B12-binding domain-containing radical SAM protein [Candidatus Omnitrophica bacterium]|nr:B12-binding domain-containing radical SAM protein [Candidatus Omnitrophota bacterium]